MVITADGYRVTDFHGNDGSSLAREFHIDWDLSAAEKGGYEYFMLGDRRAAPRSPIPCWAISSTAGSFSMSSVSDQELREIDRVFIVARHRLPLGDAGQVRHRALDAYSGGMRARERIPLP